jgi:uncharacterized damage-inducible protein DinB
MRQADIDGLFGYLYWLRDRALEEASRLPGDAFRSHDTVAYRDLRSTLVHELDVERSWRRRLRGEPREAWDADLAPDDYPDAASLATDWRRDEAEARDWLAGLTDDELAAPVIANGLEGFPLSTYLVHVVMHGVESFAAAAILLNRAGSAMGDVGFLDYIDTAGPPAGALRR